MDAEQLKLHVGPVLAEGIAQVVLRKPSDSVEFLGKWLIQFVETKQATQKKSQDDEKLRAADSVWVQEQKAAAAKAALAEQARQHAIQSVDASIAALKSCTQQESLLNAAAAAAEAAVTASGVYIAQRTDPDTLKYVASSQKGQNMLDETLPRGRGVTWNLFPAPADDEEVPETNGDPDPDEEAPEAEDADAKEERLARLTEKKRKATDLRSLNVPDVFLGPLSDNVHFFQVPKLGGYFAVRVPYYTYMIEESIEKAVVRWQDEVAKEAERVRLEEEKRKKAEKAAKKKKAAKGKKKGKKSKKKSESEEESEAEDSAASDDDEDKEEEEEALEEKAEETPAEAEEESDEDKEKRLRREAAAAAAKQEWESLSEEQKADRKQTEQFEHLVRGLRKQMVELVICADTLGQNRSFTNDQVEVLMRLAAKTRDTAQRNAYEEFAEELEKRKKLAVFTVPVKAEKDVAKEKKKLAKELKKDIESPDVAVAYRKQLVAAVKDMTLQFASWKLFKGPLSGWQCVFSLLGFEKDAFLDTQDQVRWDKCAKLINEDLFSRLASYSARDEEKKNPEGTLQLIETLTPLLESLPFDEVKEQNYPLAELIAFVNDAIPLLKLAREDREKQEEEDRIRKEKEEEKARKKAEKEAAKAAKEAEKAAKDAAKKASGKKSKKKKDDDEEEEPAEEEKEQSEASEHEDKAESEAEAEEEAAEDEEEADE